MSEITFSTPDFGSSPAQYIRDVRAELKKVQWPNRQQITQATVLVLIVSVAVGGILGGLDYAFTNLFGIIIR